MKTLKICQVPGRSKGKASGLGLGSGQGRDAFERRGPF